MIRSALLAAASILVLRAPDDGAGSGAPNPESTSLVSSLEGKLPTLTAFNPEHPETFGNGLLSAFIKTDTFDEELKQVIDTGESTKKFIIFELTKAVMHAHESNSELNIYAIFEGKTQTEKLNNRLLQHFGVIKREIKDDDIVTTWTDKALQNEYDYSAIDKEKNEAEWQRRFNNRKRLNLRFSDAIKTAVGLADTGVKADQLAFSENATTKAIEPVIKNAPPAIRGAEDKNGSTVVFGGRSPNEGASVAPNVAALVRAATKAHASDDDKKKDERADKGAERSGDAKLGMSDEDFGAIVNNLRRAIAAQEGKLSDEMVKQLEALKPYIDEQIDITAKVKAEEAADDAAGEDIVTSESVGDDSDGETAEEEVKAPAKRK